MIIVRSPLRITLGGGGSDIPSYYRKHGGFCVSAAINQYVYVAVTRPFFPNIFLKYSAIERVAAVDDVQNTRMREVLRCFADDHQIEITSLADVPAGTGLGSSSSFTAALIKAVCTYYRKEIDKHTLAEAACAIEIERLNEPIGKQDQYIATYGGVCGLEFTKEGRVEIEHLPMRDVTLFDLEESLLLFYTGIQRSAADVLRTPRTQPTPQMGLDVCMALTHGDMTRFGRLLDEQWNPDKATADIQMWRNAGLSAGAVAGKTVGAGGGGFLLFYAPDRTRQVREAMAKHGLQEVRFRFDFEGTKVLVA